MPKVVIVGKLIHYGPSHKAFDTLRMEAGRIQRELMITTKEEKEVWKQLQAQ